jgi:hypothetical protein
VVVDSLAKIGLQVKPRELADHYTAVQTVKNQIPIGMDTGWGKDYPDAATFGAPLFGGPNIVPTNNSNYGLIGLTPEKQKTLGIKVPAGMTFPSVDADIAKCSQISVETESDQRVACFVDLDKKIMTAPEHRRGDPCGAMSYGDSSGWWWWCSSSPRSPS